MQTRSKRSELWGAAGNEAWLEGKVGRNGQHCWLNGAARGRPGFPPAERALRRSGAEACGCAGCPAGSHCTRWAAFWWAGDPDAILRSQAAQNLIVLAREEAGAEKIFQSDGVRLLMQLLDTAKADLMLAALRTLVGLCSGHRSRVGPPIAQFLRVTGPGPGEIDVGEAMKPCRAGEHRWPLPAAGCSLAEQSCSELSPARPEFVRALS